MTIYKVEIDYTTIVSGRALEHQAGIWCNVDGTPSEGTPPEDVDLRMRSGALIDYGEWVTNVWTPLFEDVLHTTSTIDRSRLKRYDDPNGISTLISETGIGVSGTSASPTKPAAQTNITFRTSGGKRGMLTFLEGVIDADNYDKYPLDHSLLIPIGSYLLGTLAVPTDKYGQYITSVVGASHGQNETIWRKRFRE